MRTNTATAPNPELRADSSLAALEGLLDGVEETAAIEEPAASAARLMIVDDEPINIKVVRRYLELGGYDEFVTTTDSRQALELLSQHSPDVLILDLMMPDVSGLDILREMRADVSLSQIPVLILTATEDRELKLSALDLGATDFLYKPVDPTDLVPRVRNAYSVKSSQDRLRGYARHLEDQVRARTAELEASRLEVIYCLARAAEYRDNETGRHVMRVGRYVGVIARELGLPDRLVSLLQLAAPLHDMGKVGIADALLLKPGRLDEDEFARMKKHTEFGHDIVSVRGTDEWDAFAQHTSVGAAFMDVGQSPLLKLAASIALSHHEKWDGSGYPKRLRGEQIPIEGRITAVADVFDALGSERPYKPAFPLDKCLRIIREGSGGHFDPAVVNAFFAGQEEILRIRDELTDG